jgi:hypothetical protein
VNHCIEATERIYLRGYVSGLRDAREVANHNALGSLNRSHGMLAALLVASMENYAVARLN